MDEKLPEVLYHYTSAEGFTGIIKDKKMWATEIGYLNDSTEFRYAIDFSVRAIRVLRGEFPGDELFLDQLEKQLNGVYEQLETSDIGIFVCSFSGLGNQLSQWRGYCPNGNGYCICFDFQKLKSVAAQYHAKFEPCIYNEDEQLQKVRENLKEGHLYFQDELQAASSKQQNAQTSARIAEEFAVIFMARVAPFLKHPGFHEEKEWRLGIYPGVYGPSLLSRHLRSRTGKSTRTQIPYVEISLNCHGTFPFRKIYVGPTADVNAKTFAEQFLCQHGIDGCEVENSGIPYRLL